VDRILAVAAEGGGVNTQPQPAPARWEWNWEDPDELRRAARALERAGYRLTANKLRAWAAWYEGTGPRPHGHVQSPW
jgi:hypothetical protein